MSRLAIAMDLGTSGLRAQALDLAGGEVLASAITACHPLPGGNVIDHLHFALELGVETAQGLLIEAINEVLAELRVPLSDVACLAVCGNPTQLSLFQGMEIRDLAYAGSRKLKALGIVTPERSAAIRRAAEFPALALPASCRVIVPPAVRDEVGADALAMVMQSGILERGETAIAIDYGTNAEMVLFHEGRVVTASAAAGPALEGQHIRCGTLAMPGAVADLKAEGSQHRLMVLDHDMQPVPGALVDLRQPIESGENISPKALAITGTGVIAALEQALQTGLIALPRITTADRRLHLGRDIYLTEQDLAEAGKAIGAIRAGYMTLCKELGISPADIKTAYLAGASGTYVDAEKSWHLGLVPPGVKVIRQLGNTSLAMARQLALNPARLGAMSDLAGRLQQNHLLFAQSETFAKVFLLELSYWGEGMPMVKYREMLKRYGLPDWPTEAEAPEVFRSLNRDLGDLGRMGLVTLRRVGRTAVLQMEGCTACLCCEKECPASAISINQESKAISLHHGLCFGVACRRCERVCPTKAFKLNAFFETSTDIEAGSPPWP